MTLGQTKSLISETFKEWNEDQAPRLAAGLAYYMAFSIAPLLLISIAIAGFFFGQEAAGDRVGKELSTLLGPTAAEAINNLIASAGQERSGGIVATIIGVVVLLFGASGVFGELQHALNTVWDVEPKKGQGVRGFLRTRFLSFAMVLGIGFLLLVSLVLSAIMSAVGSLLLGDKVGATVIGQAINFVVSFAITTLLFAMMFKVIPDVRLRWKDVWFGAIVTSLLFMIGKELLGWYLGRASTTSAYGAAGSFVALLLWVYYSSQILFFGAELTQVYQRMQGATMEPSAHAQSLGHKDHSADHAHIQPHPG